MQKPSTSSVLPSKMPIKKTSSIKKRRLTTPTFDFHVKPQLSSTNLKEGPFEEDNSCLINIDEKTINGYIDEKTQRNLRENKESDYKITKKRVSFLEAIDPMRNQQNLRVNILKEHISKGKFIEKKSDTNEEMVKKMTENTNEEPKKNQKTAVISNENKEIVQAILNKKKEKKGEQKQQNSSKIAEILSKPSLKSKYEEIIQLNHEFLLPTYYKTLLNLFIAIDETLDFFKMRSHPQFFEEIQENLKLIGKEFTMNTLCQILYLFPDAYILSWEKSTRKRGDYDLLIKLPMNENVVKSSFRDNRSKEFKEKLIGLIKENHKDFLMERNQGHLIEILEASKVWHVDFDLNSERNEIPKRKLIEKPICNREVQSVHEFLKNCEEGAVKNKGLMGIMKEVAEKSPDFLRNVENNTRKLGISEKLLAKIKEKEEKLREISKTNVKPVDSIGPRKAKLRDIAEALKSHYSVKNVSNMFFVLVVDFLKNSLFTHIINSEEIKELIDILIEICPYWLEKVNNPNGIILRMNKSVTLWKILEDIVNYNRV